MAKEELNVFTVDYRTMLKAAQMAMSELQVPYVIGQPGIGKTAAAFELAQRFTEQTGNQYNVIVSKPSFHEAVDFVGAPFIKDGNTYFAPPVSLLPTLEAAGPFGILVGDELSDATISVQNPWCGLILERRINGYRVPDGWLLMATGNRVEDRSGAQKLSTKLINRVVRFDVEYGIGDFNPWAAANDIHPHIMAYTNFAVDALNTFDPALAQLPYATPRSWARASKVYSRYGISDKAAFATIAGMIGAGQASKFRSFVNIIADAVRPEDCLADPKRAPLPEQREVRFALASAFIKLVEKKDIAALRTYMARLPERDLEVFLVKTLMETRGSKVLCQEFGEWTRTLQHLL